MHKLVLRLLLYGLIIASQLLQPLSGLVNPEGRSAMGASAMTSSTPANRGLASPLPVSETVDRPAWERPKVDPVSSFREAKPPDPISFSDLVPRDARVPAPFPFGNNNFGQTYKDTNNPEDHPGRHFIGPVNAINGNLFLTVGDHFFPATGVSVQFARSYNSLDPRSGPLGNGWTHSYNTAVITETP